MPELAADQLRGRVALVTGASGGIGRAISERLGELGVAVAVGYGSSADAAQEVVDGLLSRGGRSTPVPGDLADPEACARSLEAAETALGPVDVLVANAGVGKRQTIDEVSLEDWGRTIDVNLRAPFLLVQRALPGMIERGWGRVLLMSSVAAFTGGVVGPHYAASKAGLHGLLHHLAPRVAGNGVTVNAIAPALIEETGMLPGATEELERLVPVGRLGRPVEVADVAVAVLANPYITNQVVGVDGGMHPR
jgi:3-oxoacyl-[acyl-carrier protein] reductase